MTTVSREDSAAPLKRLNENRVLFVTSDLGGVGGIPRYSRAILAALQAGSVNVSTVNLRLDGKTRHRVLAAVRSGAALLRIRPDVIVLSHVSLGPIGWIGRLLGSSYAVLAHGVEIWGPRTRRISRTLELAAAVWTNSRWTGRVLRERYPQAAPSVVLGGVVSSRFLEVKPSRPETFTVLSVANLDDLYYKGIDACLEAVAVVARTRPVRYVVVGAGRAAAEVGNRARALGVGDLVEVTEAVTDKELAAYYGRAHVAVLASRYREGAAPLGEGLGLVLLEAAAAGMAGVGANQGGSTDAVVDGVTGYLVEAGDTAALAEVLQTLADDPERCQLLGQNARRRVLESCTETAFGDRVNRALREVLDRDAAHTGSRQCVGS
jgi:glycosyltransferase involved in cell wall biosynthesis